MTSIADISNVMSNPTPSDSESSSQAPHYGTFKIIPFFRSSNITNTVMFYRDVLHFTLGGIYTPDDSSYGSSQTKPEPELTFASLFIGSKADANIYFLRNQPEPGIAMIGMSLEGLENYHLRLRGEGLLDDVDMKERRDRDSNLVTFFAFLNEGEDETREE
jgi:hypothetical protein